MRSVDLSTVVVRSRGPRDGTESINAGEKALGLVHVAVGAWLMYLTVATTLDIASGFHLPGT